MSQSSRTVRVSSFVYGKLPAFVLVFLLLLAPVGQAFAQEQVTKPDASQAGSTPTTQTSPDVQPQSDPGTIDPASPNKNTDPVIKTNTDGSVPDAAASTLQNPNDPTLDPDKVSDANQPQSLTASNPTSQGNVTDVVSVFSQKVPDINKTNGALNYEYPITVPAGRNGLTPNLKLTYNSQLKDDQNLVGYGWSLSLPYIERVNKKGSNTLYTNNYFTSSEDGNLASVTGSTYVPEVDQGNFHNYTFASNTWIVTDKNGTTYTYGGVSMARMSDPLSAVKTYRWYLTEIRDTNSNYIKYEYTQNGNLVYPSRIVYTGHGTVDGNFEVLFTTATRPDTILSYKSQFQTTSALRITEIKIQVNGTWSRKYTLGYTAGDNTVRSMLASITESTMDSSSNIVTLPAATFDYSHATPWWTSAGASPSGDPNYTGSFTMGSFPALGSNYTLFNDLNGDGYTDILYGHHDAFGTNAGALIHSGKDLSLMAYPPYYPGLTIFNNPFNSTPSLSIPSGGYFSGAENHGWGNTITDYPEGYLLSDVNGDLLPDSIHNITALTYTSSSTTYSYPAAVNSNLNSSGASWSSNVATWNTATPIEDRRWDPSASYVHGNLLDLNGDQLNDFLYDNTNVTPAVSSVQLNSGTGFNTAVPVALPTIPNSYYYHPDTDDYVDVNNDGLVDYLHLSSTFANNTAYINQGNLTWQPNTQFKNQMRQPDTFMFPGIHNFIYIDINGDGLVDIVPDSVTPANQLSPNAYENFLTYINTGNGWIAAPQWDVPRIGQLNTSVVEWNGDGLPDFINMNAQYGSAFDMALSRGSESDYLTKITLPTGGKVTMTYQSSAQYKDVAGNLLNPKLPFIVQTVKSITLNDGATNTTTTYSYEGGTYNSSNVLNRKFAGFHLVTETDPAGNVTKTYYHQGDGNDAATYEVNDAYAKIGIPYRTEKYDASGNLYATEVVGWDVYSRGAGYDFLKKVKDVSLEYDGTSSHTDTATEYAYDNSNGSLLTETNWGLVSAAASGTFTDIGTDKRITTYEYATSSTTGAVLPKHITVSDNTSTVVKENKYYYDTLAYGSVGAGNQTKVESWKSGTTYVNTQKTYNTYGMPWTSTDPDSNTTSYAYDSYNLYPVTVTDALTHTTSYTYDYITGKVASKTDANGNTWTTSYDGLGRPLIETIPDPTGGSTPVTKAIYTYVDTLNSVSANVTQYLSAGISTDSHIYYDGLGRQLQARTSTETPSTYAVKDYAYNNLGQLQKESLPYIATGSTKAAPTSTTALYANYSYDSLGRMLSNQNSVGTTSYAYAGLKTTVTDPRGMIKAYYKDAYGNLIQVDEHSGAATYTTTYTRDAVGNLTNITDALGNVRAFTYDGLGRRISAQDLHAPSDTTFGTWTYVYDNAGNMIQSVSPNAKTVNYAYDALNRQLSENYTGAAGVEITYTYDTCSNGIGHTCSVVMLSGANTNYTYDKAGNATSEAKTISGHAFTTGYTYDRQGNAVDIIYPDLSDVLYVYGSGGRVIKVRQRDAGGVYSDVLASITYAPQGSAAVLTYQNGAVTTNAYDPAHLYRLTHKTTVLSGNDYQDLSYTYDADGNITQLVDASQTNTAKNALYTYDDLNRLTQATVTGGGSGSYTKNYAYNAVGNMTNSTDMGAYAYLGNTGTSYANPHAPTSIGGHTLTYDNDGNQTTDVLGHTSAWNYKDQMTASAATLYFTYLYDHSGNRVASTTGATPITTYYPNKYSDKAGTIAQNHIYLGSNLIATFIDNGSPTTIANYAYPDPLGSGSVVIDANGDLDETIDYAPYGTILDDNIQGSLDLEHKYTGHIFDYDTGYTYYGARYYNAAVGQFTSEDAVFLSIGDQRALKLIGVTLEEVLLNPQNFNSYSYARNNPIVNTDPDGRCVEDLCVGEAALAFLINEAPAITSWFESLLTPLGQVGVTEAVDDAKKGSYGGAILGLATTGDLPETKTVKGLWSEGKVGDSALNAAKHYEKHGAQFGAESVEDYVEQAHNFFNTPPEGTIVGTSVKNNGARIFYHEASNTFGVINKEGLPQTFFKPTDGIKYVLDEVKEFLQGPIKKN